MRREWLRVSGPTQGSMKCRAAHQRIATHVRDVSRLTASAPPALVSTSSRSRLPDPRGRSLARPQHGRLSDESPCFSGQRTPWRSRRQRLLTLACRTSSHPRDGISTPTQADPRRPTTRDATHDDARHRAPSSSPARARRFLRADRCDAHLRKWNADTRAHNTDLNRAASPAAGPPAESTAQHACRHPRGHPGSPAHHNAPSRPPRGRPA